jgi:hypothetical protein
VPGTGQFNINEPVFSSCRKSLPVPLRIPFLNGIFSMATGQQLVTEEQAITVNRETGEVVMKFKLPGFPSK